MLGAGALPALGCKRPRGVPGEIRGAAHAVGHRLRTLPELGQPTRTERAAVVILGGGPSGLATAWRLRLLGVTDVLVLDLEHGPGGTSTFGRDGVVPYPWGAHYVPVPRRENVALVRLLREMGAVVGEDERGEPVPAEEMVVRDPEERLYEDGEWHEGLFPRATASPEELAEHAAFTKEVGRLASLRDGKGRRAFDIPMERGSDDPDFTALDRTTMADWLSAKGFRSKRLRWLCDYACRDDYGLRLEDASAWAGLFYFASRVRSAQEEAAPLFAWTHGNGRLVEHLAAPVLPRVRAKNLVVDVATADDRAEVVALDVGRNDVVRYVADRVVFALPKFLAPRLIRRVRDEKPAWPSSFRYGAWMVANLHLSAHPRAMGAPLAWDNVLYESASLGYVVATHQAHVDQGPTVLTYYFPYTDSVPEEGRKKLLATEHGAFSDMVMADLAPAHRDLRERLQRLDVYRWGHAMVQPRPGFLWGGARAEATKPIGRIHMAHSDLSGLALFEEALHHGVRAAEEIAPLLVPSLAGAMERWG